MAVDFWYDTMLLVNPSTKVTTALSGVNVTVVDLATNTNAALVNVDGSARANPATTDANGFVIFGALPGKYKLTISDPLARIPNSEVRWSSTPGDGIAGSQIVDNSITGAKLIDDSVTSSKIGSNAVGVTELANGSVYESAIQGSVVSVSKLKSDVKDYFVKTGTSQGDRSLYWGSASTGAFDGTAGISSYRGFWNHGLGKVPIMVVASAASIAVQETGVGQMGVAFSILNWDATKVNYIATVAGTTVNGTSFGWLAVA